MVYELSPSTLKSGLPSNRFACQRCFWLKVVKGIRQPDMSGLGKIHHEIHDWIYEYLKQQWIAILPRGRLIETELKIKARPVHGVQLWGYLDGLIELESGGYAILDLKSTQNTKWVVKNYALQLVREFGDLRSPTIGLVRLLSCLFAIERICENDGKNRWRRDEHCF